MSAKAEAEAKAKAKAKAGFLTKIGGEDYAQVNEDINGPLLGRGFHQDTPEVAKDMSPFCEFALPTIPEPAPGPVGTPGFQTWLNSGPATCVYRGMVNVYDEDCLVSGERPGYVGITVNIDRRQQQHGERLRLAEITNGEEIYRNMARSIEEALIVRDRGTGVWAYDNEIHSVSPRRDIYDQDLAWGKLGFNPMDSE